MNKTEKERLKIGPVESLPVGRGANVKREGGSELALFNIGGEFFATGNRCPHMGFPLAESRLFDDVVECDQHGWRFNVKTGECLTAPDCALQTFEVEVEDGFIYILV